MMMTSTQIKEYKELLNKKDYYIQLCTEEDQQLGLRVSYLFNEIVNIFPEYYSDLLDSGLAAANTVNAYKTHKIDPYIAGGIGQGIGGVGVGIASAVSSAQRNQMIDTWRAESSKKSDQAKQKQMSSEKLLVEAFDKLIETLDSSKNVQDYRKNQIYNSGIQLLKNKQYALALSQFEKTRNYKETEIYLKEIGNWWKSKKNNLIFKIGISIIITVVIIVLCVNSYNTSMIANTAVNDARSFAGMGLLFFGALPLGFLGAGYSQSKAGLLLGLSFGLGSILVGIGSTISRDAPQGSIEFVFWGLFLIAASVTAVCFFYVRYNVKEFKRLNSILKNNVSIQ